MRSTLTVLACLCALSSVLAIRRRQADGGILFPSEQAVDRPPCTTDTGAAGNCVPLTICQVYASDIQLLAKNVCPLTAGGSGDGNGVCCPDSPAAVPVGDSPVQPLAVRDFSPQPAGAAGVQNSDIGQASSIAETHIKEREEIEKQLVQRGLIVTPNTAEEAHLRIVFADEEAQDLGKQGLLASETSNEISSRFNLNQFSLPSVSIAQSSIASTCPKEPPCPATKYRSFDGTCNNLENKDWGKSFRAFQRMMDSQYADGVSSPRVAKDGTPLPSARLVSTTVITEVKKDYPDIAVLFSAFGQFLDHDLTLTPTTRGANGTGILCCSEEVIKNNLRHPECMQIDIPDSDVFFKQFSQTCMEFVRTIQAPPVECTLGARQQLNQLTAFIDASMIYGSNENQAKKLRSNTGGKLKVGGGNPGREFPPHANGGGCTGNVPEGKFCFQAGDVRSSEQPLLSTLHVIFLRYHNWISDQLAAGNPGWNDETLFQETRRVVGATIQRIAYNEFLPVMLGNRVMKRFDLQPQKDGFWNNYDATLDPTILNEFATAAYRFGHSTVPGLMKLVGSPTNEDSQILRNHMLRSYDSKLVDSYIRGFTTQSSEVVDHGVTSELTNHLFERNGKFGLDLAALNMQRGRDHAIGTYSQARVACGLEPVKTFQDLNKYMDANVAGLFASVYKSVEDIDLWAAGISEKPLPGAVVGPTFACINAEQFRRLRKGDRLWHERGNTESSFSEAQLAEIRQISLARLFCDHSDIKTMQPLAMLKPAQWNPEVPCDSPMIPKMSLAPWKNEPVWVK